MIEAGLVGQSMFNPSFEGWEFQAVTPVPALGISAWYVWTFVVGHSVWSIAVPIALVELLFPERGRTPWLGPAGLALTAVGYLAGCLVVWRYVYGAELFLASPGLLAGAAAVAATLIAVAFACRPAARPVADGWVLRPLPLGLVAFLAMGVYQVRPESCGGFVFGIAWLTLLAVLMSWFARQRSWGPRHQLALVAARCRPSRNWSPTTAEPRRSALLVTTFRPAVIEVQHMTALQQILRVIAVRRVEPDRRNR